MRYDVAKVTETLDKPQISDLDVEYRFHPAHRRIIRRGPVSCNRFLVAILLHSLLRLCHDDTCCYTSRPESKSPSRRHAGKGSQRWKSWRTCSTRDSSNIRSCASTPPSSMKT